MEEEKEEVTLGMEKNLPSYNFQDFYVFSFWIKKLRSLGHLGGSVG